MSLNYSRDHTVQEGLDQIAQWNSIHLMSEDLMKAGFRVQGLGFRVQGLGFRGR